MANISHLTIVLDVKMDSLELEKQFPDKCRNVLFQQNTKMKGTSLSP